MERKGPVDLLKNRKSLSKSVIPMRHNTNRGASVNHNALSAQLSELKTPKTLTYYLGKGNNEAIVRKVMNCRSVWTESEDSTSTFVNLKWQQDQRGYRYGRLVESGQYRSVANHHEYHANLSNKEYLFKNLERYCSKNSELDLWRIVPPTFILNSKDECCMQSLKLFIDYYSKNFPKPLKDKRGATEVDKEIYDERRRLRSFFFNCNLKKNLPKNPPLFDVYINKEEGDYLWIVKPPFLNRGRGIQVFSKLSQLTKFVSDNINGYVEKKLGENEEAGSKKTFVDYIKRNSEATKNPVVIDKQTPLPYVARKEQYDESEESTFDGNQFIRVIPSGPAIIKTDSFLVQKYLEKPLLISHKKFDIRMWVLVTHNMRCYVFPEGYIRLSSSEYNCKDTKEGTFVHLTNNAVQKFSADYGKVSAGNQMSFQQLKQVMESHSLSFHDCKEKIYSHMTHSLNATVKKLNPEGRKFTFQIFGYDFMIDHLGYPWLIEVNTNPCLEESSPLLKILLPRMLDDAMKLTIDNLFYGSVSTGNFQVEGYSDDNMWVPLPVSA